MAMKMKSSGSAPKSNSPYKSKVSSPLGKGKTTGAGKHPYAAKKGGK